MVVMFDPATADTGCGAGTYRSAVKVDRAGTAQGQPATELGAGEVGVVADRPKQGHIVGNIQCQVLAVDFQLNRHRLSPLMIQTARY